ncbi:MAG: EscU/YscU/HrcU family type III secretion system export apparatus switch protein [Thermodesulfobacteriota bacterium]
MNQKGKRSSLKRAVALKYIPKKDRAPKITAKGSGILAQKIIELAKKHGVPIQEDPALVEVLAQLDFYQEIPPSVYVIVAEILAFIYSMNHRWSGGESGTQ